MFRLDGKVAMITGAATCAYRKPHLSQPAAEHGPWGAEGLPGLR